MSGAAVQRNALGEVARWQGSESLFASRRWRDVALTLASSFSYNKSVYLVRITGSD